METLYLRITGIIDKKSQILVVRKGEPQPFSINLNDLINRVAFVEATFDATFPAGRTLKNVVKVSKSFRSPSLTRSFSSSSNVQTQKAPSANSKQTFDFHKSYYRR